MLETLGRQLGVEIKYPKALRAVPDLSVTGLLIGPRVIPRHRRLLPPGSSLVWWPSHNIGQIVSAPRVLVGH